MGEAVQATTSELVRLATGCAGGLLSGLTSGLALLPLGTPVVLLGGATAAAVVSGGVLLRPGTTPATATTTATTTAPPGDAPAPTRLDSTSGGTSGRPSDEEERDAPVWVVTWVRQLARTVEARTGHDPLRPSGSRAVGLTTSTFALHGRLTGEGPVAELTFADSPLRVTHRGTTGRCTVSRRVSHAAWSELVRRCLETLPPRPVPERHLTSVRDVRPAAERRLLAG